MKPDNLNEQELFDRLRQSPTELSLEKVTAIIDQLPNLPPPPNSKNNWTYLFNLNTLIMLTISIAIAIGLLSYNGSSDTSGKISHQQDLPVKEIIEEVAIIESSPLKEITKNTQESITTIPQDTIVIPSHKNEIIKEITSKKISHSSMTKKEKVFTDNKPLLDLNPATAQENSPRKYTKNTIVVPPNIKSDPSPVPDLGGLEMRKIKRQLYRNLKEDGLVLDNLTLVEMELPGDQIIVNGETLEGQLFLKYSELTKKVGIGPLRKIKMNEAYILAGDFTTEGFKGSGVGTFIEEMAEGEGGLFGSRNKEEESREQELNLEKKNLYLFSKRILDQQPKRKGRKKLFSVNINGEKIRELFDDLHQQLLADQMIKTIKDFVLIELPKDEIRVNGQSLNPKEYTKYSNLLSKYNTGRGAIRQIRLSEHYIGVGDFKSGNFTGTIATFED